MWNYLVFVFLFFLNWWYWATTLWPLKCQSRKHPGLLWREDLIMMDLHGFEVERERERERRGLLSAKRKLSVRYVGLRNEKVSSPLLLEHLSGRGREIAFCSFSASQTYIDAPARNWMSNKIRSSKWGEQAHTCLRSSHAIQSRRCAERIRGSFCSGNGRERVAFTDRSGVSSTNTLSGWVWKLETWLLRVHRLSKTDKVIIFIDDNCYHLPSNAGDKPISLS